MILILFHICSNVYDFKPRNRVLSWLVSAKRYIAIIITSPLILVYQHQQPPSSFPSALPTSMTSKGKVHNGGGTRVKNVTYILLKSFSPTNNVGLSISIRLVSRMVWLSKCIQSLRLRYHPVFSWYWVGSYESCCSCRAKPCILARWRSSPGNDANSSSGEYNNVWAEIAY